MQTVAADLYLPRQARIDEIVRENSQIKTFVLSFVDQERNRSFSYQSGQFMMVSLPHLGEAPISFSSTPTRPGSIQLSVRRAGRLTRALHEMEVGGRVGLRGPYGRPFPLAELVGHDLIFVAGGIGLAPLRSVVNACLDEREKYGRLTVLYGSRTPSDLAFSADLGLWSQSPGFDCRLTVDATEPGWGGAVGVVTNLLAETDISPEKTVALVCGPPMMIRAVLRLLSEKGLPDAQIITTMERHMKCGVGICRHCHLEGKLVCVDGPVFTLAELRRLSIMELAG
ncbi:FAD/NAD(P)-binding protein [Thiovibrio sp. JS02]